MKCFVPMDEDAILKLWVKNPKLVAPFSRPFYPSAFSTEQERYPTEVSELLAPKKKARK